MISTIYEIINRLPDNRYCAKVRLDTGECLTSCYRAIELKHASNYKQFRKGIREFKRIVRKEMYPAESNIDYEENEMIYNQQRLEKEQNELNDQLYNIDEAGFCDGFPKY